MHVLVLTLPPAVFLPLLPAGCTHFIIGRDMAGCKSTISGEDFYGAYDAQNLAGDMAAELGMQTVPSLNIAYTEEQGYVTADVAKAENLTTLSLSGTKFRQMLRSGGEIPEWFAFKSVVEVLRAAIKEEEEANN
jgi:sulfate adenylyltransferase